VEEVWLLVKLIGRLMERLTLLHLQTAINLPVLVSLILKLLPHVRMKDLRYDGPTTLQDHEEMSPLGVVPMNRLGAVPMNRLGVVPMPLLVDWGADLLGSVLSSVVGDLQKIVKSVKIVGNFDSD